ncbi:MAG: T9SS type A sorting domain-containing protein [Flavobacterium sp.]|nr:T9SS type A sorting domain-containing protein [Flavobacterium sp.]
MHYNINFENVGTADAVNVVIKDLIDTTMFDMNSLQLLYASHPVETKIDGNKVEFIFENINLPPSIIDPIGGHGNVLFKIKTLPTLLVGDQIANIANIYFDYNAPIETNEARSTFATLNNSNFVKDASISIAPNPAKNNVIVTSKGNLKSIELFDVQGRILQTILEDKHTATIDISNQSNGIYFLKVTTEIGSSVEKLVKEN